MPVQENTRDQVDFYVYTDDGGGQFKVRLTSSVATAGGFSLATGAELTLPRWKGGSRTMRRLHIRTADKRYHDTIPVADRTLPLWNNGGTVDNIAGRNGWICTGRTGESFTFS